MKSISMQFQRRMENLQTKFTPTERTKKHHKWNEHAKTNHIRRMWEICVCVWTLRNQGTTTNWLFAVIYMEIHGYRYICALTAQSTENSNSFRSHVQFPTIWLNVRFVLETTQIHMEQRTRTHTTCSIRLVGVFVLFLGSTNVKTIIGLVLVFFGVCTSTTQLHSN